MSTQSPTEEQLRWELAQARKRIDELQTECDRLLRDVARMPVEWQHEP